MGQTWTQFLERYVEDLKTKGAIRSEAVERAFRKVPRHRLIERLYVWDEEGPSPHGEKPPFERPFHAEHPVPDLLARVYSDEVVLVKLDPPSSSSQPYLVAEMLELLSLRPGMNVLEIGAGTGYNAALMQEIVGAGGRITTVDIQEDLVERARRLLVSLSYNRIRVVAGDGAVGCAQSSPYHRIVATVGCPDISWRWAEQLRPEGYMLIPLQHGRPGSHFLVTIRRGAEGALVGEVVGWSAFMAIQGELAGGSAEPAARKPSGTPTAEHPPLGCYHGLEAAQVWRPGSPAAGFFLFMALRDPRACWSILADDRLGVVRAEREKTILWGDPSLYEDLLALHEGWRAWGSPGLADWRLEFYPQGKAPGLAPGEQAFVIERKFTTQRACLQH